MRAEGLLLWAVVHVLPNQAAFRDTSGQRCPASQVVSCLYRQSTHSKALGNILFRP